MHARGFLIFFFAIQNQQQNYLSFSKATIDGNPDVLEPAAVQMKMKLSSSSVDTILLIQLTAFTNPLSQ